MQASGSTMGVEEEFLLVDAETRRTVPRAAAILADVATMPVPAPGVLLQAELAATQLEAATGVCVTLTDLRRHLTDARARLANAARAEGLRLVSAGNPVLTDSRVPFTPTERYLRIAGMLAGALDGYQCCGCHVHVGVPDRETAVGVVNHLRRWLPTLVALGANSPFDRGRDSGYASWRIQAQARFPGSGVPPWSRSAAAYDVRLDRLVEVGVLADTYTTYWLARPSQRLPTVEIRAADAAMTVDEAVLQAALARALVRTALTDLAAGREAPVVNEQLCAAALWSAARYGLAGPGVDPLRECRVPADRLVEELVEHISPALEEAGDVPETRRLLHRVRVGGTGADRQRRAATAGLPNVVDMLVRRLAENL